MRGVRRIADQHDIFVEPFFAQHSIEFQPDGRTLQVLCVRNQSVAVEPVGKQLFAERD